MKILVIEDNLELAQNITEYLQREGYVCELADSHAKAVNKLGAFAYDCVVLDIMLPDGNGLDILRFVKNEKIKSCVLIISAKNSLDDKVIGLELGADDYLTKPFHLPELNARLKALYRRKYIQGDKEIFFNEIHINMDTMETLVNKQLLELTRKEYALLVYFLTNKNRVLTRQSIAEHLWGDYADNLLNFDFVYQHVKNLRKKIIQAGGKDYIETVYGLGYKFNANRG
ncbi:DNA-binding response OmpR family regulator [Anseongella ginsenosidimutans]|uniref:DNA-binding response OmpR family regulator n=1 Tax=Anseongella ginsenosidimutans TaxID=496056 RepID=A0A4R3KTD3_9SPHI|nr:response regulator transcription factor [Anseongella ginsenosidimutans]QEC53157.1 response regulator transcription factor [Anseongella ginsenosidimutans]TCS87781.1 DNA-binding response OmpR family regulator [Anseongella ginsenosidimutans]